MKQPLLFVDTNIYLNFYRAEAELGLGLLTKLATLKDQIITTHQVQMEFDKNRLRVILEAIKNLELSGNVSIPAFLREAKAAGILAKDLEAVRSGIKSLKHQLRSLLSDAFKNDPVYKNVHSLFDSSRTDLNLFLGHRSELSIRENAWHRFVSGFPPQKAGDSVGDGINWLWLLECAAEARSSVVVVSRDSDYGVTTQDGSFVNDYLSYEFKVRVGSNAHVHLCRDLSTAMKEFFNIKVTKAELEAERISLPNLSLFANPLAYSVLPYFGSVVARPLAAGAVSASFGALAEYMRQYGESGGTKNPREFLKQFRPSATGQKAPDNSGDDPK